MLGMGLIYAVLAGLGSYALSSIVLFYHPEILHKPRKMKKCRHISHRGGAGENYENTMGAFSHAVKLGTNMLEMDCHLTKDKQVVVLHDACLLRTTGHDVLVKDLDYSQLPLIKTSINIDFDPGNHFTGSEDERLRKIPLLSEVFKAFPNLPINIDVKQGGGDLIKEINKLVVIHQREEDTVWGSFMEEVGSKCYQQNPRVGRFFSLAGVMKLYFFFYSGLLPFISLSETHLEIPMYTAIDSSGLSRKQRLILWLASVLILRPALFRHLEKRGIPTYVWVLNDERSFQRALDLKVTGIMTDYPTKLRRFLDERDKGK